jgi:bacterioferritin-associated ferredoxin
MIICVCKAVSDRRIRAAVNKGASSLRDLTLELGVGSCCGKCLPHVKATLSQCVNAREEPASPADFFPPAGTEMAV